MKVCTLEIWCEALGGSKQTFTNAKARELNAIMQGMKGWKVYKDGKGTLRFGSLYGIQKGYVRV